MNIISIINIKGGVGKSTTTFNLAGTISKMGKKVLVIDNDPQSNLTQFCDMEEIGGFNMYDLYTNPKVTVSDCIKHFEDNFYIINNKIDTAKLERAMGGNRAKEYILRDKFKQFREECNGKYDIVLIDNSPFLGSLTTNAMTVSNCYISVVDNSISALKGLSMVDELVEDLYKYNWNTHIYELGVLRNNWIKRSKFNRAIDDSMVDILCEKLFDTVIYNSIKYKEAAVMGKTIDKYSKKQAEEIEELYIEIIKRLGDKNE